MYVKNSLKCICGIVVVLILFIAMSVSHSKGEINSDVKFQTSKISGDMGNKPAVAIKEVNPSYKNIEAWISSVGSGVALNDIDNDGYSDDICLVDPSYNNVTIQTADNEYDKFELRTNDETSSIAPMGCVPADLNEDGLLDIIVYYWGKSPLVFMQNNNKMKNILSAESFTPEKIIKTNEEWYTNALSVSDLDGDGKLDILVGNYFPENSQVLNNSSSKEAFMQDSMSKANNGGKNRILLNQGGENDLSVNFKDASDALPSSYLTGWTLALGAADLNKDHLPDIYFANDFGPDRLLMNQSSPGNIKFSLVEGNRSWKTPRSEVLGKDSFKGMGVEFVDLNKDGWLDILVSNIAEEKALLETNFAFINTGDWGLEEEGLAPFENKSVELGINKTSWGWDIKAGDFNNDGTQEIIQSTGFIKGGNKAWEELQELATINDTLLKYPSAWPNFKQGIDISGKTDNAFFIKGNKDKYINSAKTFNQGRKTVSRGISISDINGDGKLDFVMANQWDDSYIYINNTENKQNFIGIDLTFNHETNAKNIEIHKGKQALKRKTAVIGATLEVYLPNGEVYLTQVDGGIGHSGKRSNEIHVGLGEIKTDNLKGLLSWRDLNGKMHSKNIQLAKGWQTIILPKGSD